MAACVELEMDLKIHPSSANSFPGDFMRIVLTAATMTFAASFAGLASAQSDAPTAISAKPVDAETVKKAEGMLKASAKAYASAKALADTITFTAKTPQGDQSQSMKIMLQGDDSARVTMDEMTLTVLGKALYAEKSGIADRYAQFDIDGDIASALGNEIGFVPPQFVARTTDDTQRLIDAWTFQMLPNAKITDVTIAKSDAGEELQSIVLTSDEGTGAIHMNAKSMLVQEVLMHIKPQGAPAEFDMNVILAYAPKVMDALEPAITFEPGSRQKVSSLDDLKIDLSGKAAPDFTLESLDGSKVTLSELKGNVVILDFWATWCGPCKMALPKLNEFAQWAKDNNKAVKVYAVDVWERTKGDETKRAVTEFWTSKGYVMPTLLDTGDETAKKYGFDSIPTTIVVGPDGKVFTIHVGFNPDMVEELKKNVEEALAAVK